MTILGFSPILLIILGFIIYSILKGNSGIRVMIIGIHFSLLGLGLIFISESDLVQIGFIVMVIGLLISTFGLVKKEK